MLRFTPRWLAHGLLFACLVMLFIGCGSPPSRDLFYVRSGSGCPSDAPPALDLSQPAGFTSRVFAVQVAATETSGIHRYWRRKVKSLESELRSVRRPAPWPALIAKLDLARTEKRAFSRCRRIVVKGQPNG